MVTSRPEIVGTFGVVATTHWLATTTGMTILEQGGNAFDAAVAAGFVLHIVEPDQNGPGGDLPIVLWSAARGKVEVICGQGVAPAAARIDALTGLGLDVMPGTGHLPAVVPGSFDAWMLPITCQAGNGTSPADEPASVARSACRVWRVAARACHVVAVLVPGARTATTSRLARDRARSGDRGALDGAVVRADLEARDGVWVEFLAEVHADDREIVRRTRRHRAEHLVHEAVLVQVELGDGRAHLAQRARQRPGRRPPP